jgi:hypothetical protein
MKKMMATTNPIGHGNPSLYFQKTHDITTHITQPAKLDARGHITTICAGLFR